MKPAQLARLLQTAGDYRRGYELTDSRTAAIVLLSASAGIGPVAALRWTAADVIREAAPAAGQWAIRSSVPHKRLAQVLPIDCRAALLVYVRFAIWAEAIRSIDAPRFFPLGLRAVQIDLNNLLRRADLADKGITFHSLKPQPRPTQAREHKPPRSVEAAARDRSEQRETERPPAPPPDPQTVADPQQSRRAPDPA
jgi:hypothetical protein